MGAMEPVDLLHEYAGEVLHRWRYERCHMSRQATVRLLRLADGRYAVDPPRGQGMAYPDLDEALSRAEAVMDDYHAGQQASPYGGPGPDVGEWVEREPYAGGRPGVGI